MENKTKDAGKDRVVLALTTEQAKQLNYFIKGGFATDRYCKDIPEIISKRIEKTLAKQQIAREHPEFTKEQINKAYKTFIGETEAQ